MFFLNYRKLIEVVERETRTLFITASPLIDNGSQTDCLNRVDSVGKASLFWGGKIIICPFVIFDGGHLEGFLKDSFFHSLFLRHEGAFIVEIYFIS